MANATKIYPEVHASMQSLKRCGLRMAIVSTKYRPIISTVLERNDLCWMFDVIVGGDDVSRPKPDPQGIEMALAIMKIRQALCIYVGDADVDAEAAAKAGVRFIRIVRSLDCTIPGRGSLRGHPIVSNLNELALLIGCREQSVVIDSSKSDGE